ncbi:MULTISPECIES: HAD-IIB family hydrolase [unclassified Pseudomonas]|uniref:HAD-IIB family hydrolase n=1 Tax=unclassified Pseudomonas TaxID=196821 RepID=UPI0009DD0D72|nr:MULTISPECIES: HAD family hydrolase [unclassified Pseudomonas]SME95224.1 Cof subfamily of IIB subfamily of haloacid dehalogenase superfamily/HAD-superfamily hydrolase, subfamily IIB [Pseudomonas sp. LAMO17WK12:I1]
MYSLLTNSPKPLPDALCDPSELLPFAKVKLIAFDLDGTLILRPQDPLGNRLIKLFSLLSGPGRNLHLTLATGRTLTGVSATVKQLGGFSKVPLVLYNGSVVMQPEKQALVAHEVIAQDVVANILQLICEFHSAALFIYTVDPEAKLISDYSSTESVFFKGKAPKPELDFNGMSVRDFSEIDFSSDKVVAMLIAVTLPEEKKIIVSRLNLLPGVSVTASGSVYIELRPIRSSKALGLKVLCDRYGISPQHVLAVGDNDNDVELLTWAGLSVCVKNSSDAARASSKFYSVHGAGKAAIDVLEIVRRAQRLFGKARKA